MRPILHHYPNSPFSEKIRTIFGFKNIAWSSVLIPPIMPKPDVIALTGGYRKTPVLQIGSDIYCDTALIADVLEDLEPEPSLYPPASAGLARTLAQWADTTLFWTAIPYTMQPAGMAHLFAALPSEAQKAFIADRVAFRGSAPRMRLPEASLALQQYLGELEALLGDARQWLLGSTPSIADFAVYHCVWYVSRGGPPANVLEAYPQLVAWLSRMKALGHGEFDKCSSEEAIALAQAGAPDPVDPKDFLDTHGLAFGSPVTVAATDYGTDPVSGTWVISRPNEIGIERKDSRAGTVIVHFPRIGFELRRAESA
ncbi:MAG: glutathione S-transferase family protein [Burkholderiaceae bacterium]|jgi:glutathione S-transferase